MECRWENFGIERRDGVQGLGLAIPETTSLRNFMGLAECTGPKGLQRICIDSANILNATTTLLFDDWQITFQPDVRSRELGRTVELDLTALHRMTKYESVPDYIVHDANGVPRNLISFSGPLPRDLARIAEGLEVARPEAALEIGFNLRNLQLVLASSGGRILFSREEEHLELPEID